jgi:hypothetical protein
MAKSEAGKGSERRPMFISWEQWDKNYERAFGKKKVVVIEPPKPKLKDLL